MSMVVAMQFSLNPTKLDASAHVFFFYTPTPMTSTCEMLIFLLLVKHSYDCERPRTVFVDENYHTIRLIY